MLTKTIITLLSRCSRYALRCYGEAKWDAALTLKGYVGDKRLGIDTGWYDYINAHKSSGDSFRYEPTSYAVLKKVIEYIKFNKDDVFIDYGCGSGRVVFTIATQLLKKVIGIEFDEALVMTAKENLSRFKHKNSPIEFVHIDATIFNPAEGTIFFFGNPFGEKTLKIVMDNIKNSLNINPRQIKIVYFNSTGKNVLEKLDWLEFEAVIDNSNSGTTVWRNKVLYQRAQ